MSLNFVEKRDNSPQMIHFVIRIYLSVKVHARDGFMRIYTIECIRTIT